jgi:hypothetical protein
MPTQSFAQVIAGGVIVVVFGVFLFRRARPGDARRSGLAFGLMLALGVAITLLSMFFSSSPLLVIGLLLALAGSLGSLSRR